MQPDSSGLQLNQADNQIPPLPGVNSTSGGRAIPPRSELRNPTPQSSPPPPRSDLRNSQNLSVQPLNTNYSPSHAPTYSNDSAIATSPISPTTRPKTPNFSRPGVTGVTGVTAQGEGGKRTSVISAMKGLHGAGEALRGSVNSTIAKGVGDTAEQERMRAVREQGINEFRGSGIREGFREKAEGRMRLRRRSGSANPGEGLARVDEGRGVGV